MIEKIRKQFFCCVIFLVCINAVAHAEVTALEEILGSADAFNETAVEVEGEAIGEPLKVEGGAWINLSSEGMNIGVFVSDRLEIGMCVAIGHAESRGGDKRVVMP